ncbi:MAG: amidohydrolase, partial [Burkholderiales bacterium]
MKTNSVLDEVEASRDELVALRHTLHQNPEIGHKEFNTARLVADKLALWGFKVTEGVGGTGVVGTLSAGSGSQSIGVRADMDAL